MKSEKISTTTKTFRRAAVLALFALLFPALRSPAQTLSLEQAIREVCTNSDSVKMMKESVKKANEMVREKWANALPVISATGVVAENYGSLFGGSSSSSSGSRSMSSASLGKAAETAGPSDSLTSMDIAMLHKVLPGMLSGLGDLGKQQYSTIYSTGISINQPIFTFGKIGTAVEVAKNFNKSAKATYKRNIQGLQLGAVDAFSNAVKAKKYAEITERSLARKKDLNEFQERNFQLGSGRKAQVLSTKADMLSQISIVLIAHRDARNARMYLNAALGRPLTDSADLDTEAVPAPLLNPALLETDKTIAEAINARMDLKSLKLLAASTRGGAKIMRAMYLPSIGATGSLGYSKMQSDIQLFPTDWKPNWTLGLGASWTLFDGFENSARAAQFQSDADKLEIACKAIEKAVEIEIRSAIEECKAADSNLTASQAGYSAAKEGYELTNSDFKQGSSQVQLIDLQRVDDQLQMAELGLINARYRQIRSRAALLVSMGKDIIPINQEE